MSKYIINGETLEKIADAIREKTGGTEQMTPAAMVEAINGLGTMAEPYVEYTMSTDGKVTAIALHGFINIPVNAFNSYTALKHVDFSGSPNLTSIGNGAFGSCTNLALTALPESLTSIGDNAFGSCANLALTTLPESLTSIGNNAFSYCPKLALTTLPESLTSIGSYAFSGCTKLALTTLPESLANIGNNAFQGCTNLVNIEIMAKELGTGVFNYCDRLANVWIRSTCTTIVATSQYNSPFNGCMNLAIYAEPTEKPADWGIYYN